MVCGYDAKSRGPVVVLWMQDLAHRQDAGGHFPGAHGRHPLSEEIDKDKKIRTQTNTKRHRRVCGTAV